MNEVRASGTSEAMQHPSEIVLVAHVDAALPEDERSALDLHLAACDECAGRLADLRAETDALRAALVASDPEVIPPPFVPALEPMTLLKWFAGLSLAALVVDGAWRLVGPALVLPQWLDWLLPDLSMLGLDVVWMLVGTLTGAERSLVSTLQLLVVVAMLSVIAAGVWLLFARRRDPRTCSGVWAAVLLLSLVSPFSQAFEVRHDDKRVVVAVDEVIDDTLIATGESVLIEGTVTGDLLVFGERIQVRGHVGGVVIAAGQEVTLEGGINGTVLAAGETVVFRDVRLGGNVFAAGREVTMYPDTEVAGNAALAASEVQLQGTLERDLLAAAGQVGVLGRIAGNLTAFADQLDLAHDARIDGDLTASVRDAGDLQVAGDARVGGAITLTEKPAEPPKHVDGGFYFGKIVGFLGMLVTGLVLFWLFPGLQAAHLNSGVEAARTGGIGVLLLVATPILALMAAATLVAAPLAILALALWLAGLYLSGIVTAGLVGRLLVDPDRGHVLAYVAGLAVVFVLINMPLVGGLVRFVVMVMGFGLLFQWQREARQRRSV